MELAAVKNIGQNGTVQHGDDSGLLVEFYTDAVQNQNKTMDQGRPIFDTLEMVRIQPIGQNKSIHVCKVDPDVHPFRFPRQWAQFKAQEEQVKSGTPITEWPPLTKSQAMEMKALGVHTVEDLASISDANLGQWLGARQLRDQAIAWMDQATSGAAISKMQGQLNALSIDNAALKQQVIELSKPKAKGKTDGNQE